jgi:hypothetical protein
MLVSECHAAWEGMDLFMYLLASGLGWDVCSRDYWLLLLALEGVTGVVL